jgi:hypothetical protein
MARFILDAVHDLALANIATCTRVVLCSSQPANFAGIAAVTLGSYTLTAGSGNGDWLIGDGDVSGRKLTLLAQSGNNASASGTGDHLSFDDGSVLRAVATCASEVVVNGEPFNISALDVVEYRDPAAP